MEYRKAFWYILDRRGGFVSLLLLTVCQFIPVIGPIVMLGYRAEVAVALARDPDLRRHPKFKFDYFVDYLIRGVWPFLIRLIISALMVPIMILAVVAWFLIFVPGQNNPPMIMFVFLWVVVVILSIVMSALSVPMSFHAEFTGKFDFGGAFRFAVRFWTLVGGRALITGLAYFFLSFIVVILGMLVCCVGMYPAAILAQMAGTHLIVQLYRKYLDWGGLPLVEYDPQEREDRRDDRPRRRDRDERRWERYDEREDERWLRFDESGDDPPRE